MTHNYPASNGGALRAFSPRVSAAAGLALLASAALAPIFAQTAPATTAESKEDVVKMERFVSVGTRFGDRTVIASPVPIDVIISSEIRQSGYTETAQVIQTLIPSFNFPRATIGDGTDHIRPATIRGLAPDQTLVLINGKRRHTSSLVNVNGTIGRGSVSVDFNAVPSTAINGIEVLRDGAAAQYGSDAIAGVINITLRKDLGYSATGTWGQTRAGDGMVLEGGFDAGLAFGEGGVFHASLFYRDRENTNRSESDTRMQYFGFNAAGARTAISGNYKSGTTNAPAGIRLDPREATINRLNHRQGDGDSKDRGFFLNGSHPIGKDGAEFYSFGGYSLRNGEAAGFFRRAGDNRTVRAIYPDGFLPLIQSKIADYSFAAGFKGKAGDWYYDASAVTGENQFDYTINNTHNVTLGANSPKKFYAGVLQFGQTTLNLDLTRNYNTGGQAPLKTALGFEYRNESYKIGAGQPDSWRDGGVLILDGPAAGTLGAPGAQVFPGFRPSDAVSKARHSYAVYADFENQVTAEWLVSAAARYEDFTDFGGTFNMKGSSRFEISKAFALRGSVSTGFRAPHLAQQWFSSTATNFIGGVPFDNRTFPVKEPVARLLGAKNLKPETSNNLSVGLTFQPVPGFTASVDYYHIKIDDRIVLSSTFIDSGTTLIKDFLAANGQAQAVGGRYFTNAVDTTTEGIDVNGRYTIKTDGAGKFTFTAGYNHNTTKVTRFSDTPAQLKALTTIPLFDVTEKIRMEKGQSKDNFNATVNWDFQKFSFLARFVRYGEVSVVQTDNSGWAAARVAELTPGHKTGLAPAVPTINAAGVVSPNTNQQVIQTFGAKWLTDLDLSYQFSKRIRVSVGANNLFDVYPERNIASTVNFLANDNAGIFPYNGVSPFGANGRFYYTRLTVKF